MCTCITYENGDFYFGRNLDLDCSFGETVTITPRNFPLAFRREEEMKRHYAMIGMASAGPSDPPSDASFTADCDIRGAFPLYAEAVNEKGLAMAGLNFPGNAFYQKPEGKGLELASFEIIPWILGKCASVREAESYLSNLKIVNLSFAEQLPAAPLHWMVADREKCLVLEAVQEGLRVYENPAGVLTNNPPFPFHRANLGQYLNLTAQSPENRFSGALDLKPVSQGMGALGLPGDASSASRFVRAAFLKWNSVSPQEENANVAQFFHILDGVAMVRGAVVTEQGTYDITTYSCCINTRTGRYYYKTYEDSRVRGVDLRESDLEGTELVFVSGAGGAKAV